MGKLRILKKGDTATREQIESWALRTGILELQRHCPGSPWLFVAKNVPLSFLWRPELKSASLGRSKFRETHQENQNTGNSSILRFLLLVFPGAKPLRRAEVRTTDIKPCR
jgi:hypothetical protein